jgi:hypothetical protein
MDGSGSLMIWVKNVSSSVLPTLGLESVSAATEEIENEKNGRE